MFFNQKITIFHYNESSEKYTRIEYNKVYFRHNKKSNNIDKGLEKASVGTIIIPTTDIIKVSVGDYIVEGTTKKEFNIKTMLNEFQLFKVISIDDNRKGNLQHFKIGVGE